MCSINVRPSSKTEEASSKGLRIVPLLIPSWTSDIAFNERFASLRRVLKQSALMNVVVIMLFVVEELNILLFNVAKIVDLFNTTNILPEKNMCYIKYI